MLLFPLTYVFAFLKTIKGFTEKKIGAILIFICFGLPIYINTLSVMHMWGFSAALPLLQWAKECIVLITLGIIAYHIKEKPKLALPDKLVLAFISISSIYLFIPIGSYSFFEKLIALKSVSFFALLYAMGRCIPKNEIQLGKLILYISVVTSIAAIVVLGEFILYEHLHVHSGFANFIEDIFGAERSGHYDLLWTFEIESGAKRFGSIFANPLEFAAAMILSISLYLGYFTNPYGEFQWNKHSVIGILACCIGIILALSRASFLGFMIVIYLYALITKNAFLRKGFYLAFIFAGLYLIYFLSQHDFYDFIINTITFSNASSLGHVLEWLEGIEALIANPFGLGLGESGRVSGFSGDHTGGENQFIITGVQLGIPLLIIYMGIHISLIRIAWKNRRSPIGKLRRLAIGLFLFKIGFLLPMFTANTESYIYLSYLSWFLSGFLVSMVQSNALIKQTPLG